MRGILRSNLTAFAITAAINVPAYAAPADDPPSIRVPVSAADLATGVAVKKLTEKLWSAVRQVCKKESASDDGYLFTHACQSRAMDDALAQLDGLRTDHVAALSTASIVIATHR